MESHRITRRRHCGRRPRELVPAMGREAGPCLAFAVRFVVGADEPLARQRRAVSFGTFISDAGSISSARAVLACARERDLGDSARPCADRWPHPLRAALVPGPTPPWRCEPDILGCAERLGPSNVALVTDDTAWPSALRGIYDCLGAGAHQDSVAHQLRTQYDFPFVVISARLTSPRRVGSRQMSRSARVTYDYDAIAPRLSRSLIESRPKTYGLSERSDDATRHGPALGFTPRARGSPCPRLAWRSSTSRRFGQSSRPVLQDRVVSVAATRAVELVSRVRVRVHGHLAGSVAAHAARLGVVQRLHPGRPRA